MTTAATGLSNQSARLRLRLCVPAMAIVSLLASTLGQAETRPHYGGTLRVMMRTAPDALDLPADAPPAAYWDISRTLSLIGDTLLRLDAQSRPHPALALAWQSDAASRHWQFALRRGVKFHDGSPASPAAIAQILSTLHPAWVIRAAPDSIFIESDGPMPSLLAELALPRNLLLKQSGNGLPLGTGAFFVSDWRPGKLLKLAANEESWEGRPFVDAVEIEFGKTLHDQAIAFELDKADVIESAPQSPAGTMTGSQTTSQRHPDSSSLSLSVELLALTFSPQSRAQDPRFREALALSIDRKPIQSVLLKGAGEPAATILPNWMTGYTVLFSARADPQRARSLLAGSRQPALNLSYDPRDPYAQLIAERIALNAREIGITVQVSLSEADDLRLVRVVLPSPDPATSLREAARQMGVPAPAWLATLRANSLDDLYQAERATLEAYSVIPLFHLPLAYISSARVHYWQSDRAENWIDAASTWAGLNSASNSSAPDAPGSDLVDIWLAEPRPADARSLAHSEAGLR